MMQAELEAFEFGYILTEIRETKDVIKAKMFSQKDLEAFELDEVQNDLAKILKPLNETLVKLAWR